MTTVGEALVTLLERQGVDTVFGIPGVHTIELYRGLAGSSIRHVTPRHEQGAAFMADGYARASGKPGVIFVITGPGLTNTITAMGQARADSVPMLVISGVNQMESLGKGLGFLHELPDQRGMIEKVALSSTRINGPSDLQPAIERAFALFDRMRPGPVHIEIPLDVMTLPAARIRPRDDDDSPEIDFDAVMAGARILVPATRPLILAGGGARRAEAELIAMAERLDAPVVLTVNARGLLHRHPLAIPASPGLPPVRALIDHADAVLAVGTEFGPTDYDMYADGNFDIPPNLVRIDIDAEQLDRRSARVRIEADSRAGLAALLETIPARALQHRSLSGAERAADALSEGWSGLGQAMQAQVGIIQAIRDNLPNAVIVGDSTQPIYAANLWYDHDRPSGWFNAATGFGALGYGPPAAIGAAIALPHATVICLTGDGGFQFSLPELAAAVEETANVIFVVWNNRGYREIKQAMLDAGVAPVGVTPSPPDFALIAAAYGIGYRAMRSDDGAFGNALRDAKAAARPFILELAVD